MSDGSILAEGSSLAEGSKLAESSTKTNQLDARRLLCPLPVIRTQDAIAKLQENELLTITCTDPGVKVDIPSWCRINGHEVISVAEKDHEIIITIKIGASG